MVSTSHHELFNYSNIPIKNQKINGCENDFNVVIKRLAIWISYLQLKLFFVHQLLRPAKHWLNSRDDVTLQFLFMPLNDDTGYLIYGVFMQDCLRQVSYMHLSYQNE